MLGLLLLAAATQTPVDAERAFAADARTIGQWTAFRKWSTDDAIMFAPQPINAHAFLKDRKDPREPIDWWPTASWISCDGTLAVNTGGSRRPDGSVGYFSTVWQRQPDGGWKWIVDGGDDLATTRPRPARVVSTRASCRGHAPRAVDDVTITADAATGAGESRDHSLRWRWTYSSRSRARYFQAEVWNGRAYRQVLADPPAFARP